MPWIALPARSPPSTITSGWYTAAALTNFRKHLSEPCRSVAKYSRVDRPTGSVNRGMRALPVDHLDHLAGPAGVHGIPGVPIHFQTGAHDHPVAVGQDLLDILLVDAGVRQQRQVGDRLARGGQVGHLDAGAGGRPADQLVGDVVLVAEQQAVHARLLQGGDVRAQCIDDGLRPGGHVMPRATGERPQMAHRDQRLVDAKDGSKATHVEPPSEPVRTTRMPSARTASSSAGFALLSVTSVFTEVMGDTAARATEPSLEPSAITITASLRSIICRLISATSSSSSVMPLRPETPAAPITATSAW